MPTVRCDPCRIQMDLDLSTVKARVAAELEHVKKQERAFVLYAQRWWDEASLVERRGKGAPGL